MKYGNFVGKKSIDLSEEEEKMFKLKFQNILQGLDFKFEKVSISSMGDYGVIYSFLYSHKEISGRNINFDRVYGFNGVSFIIQKETGYLDKTDWMNPSRDEDGRTIVEKDFVNAPKFQYSIFFDCLGHLKRYHCSHSEVIELKGHFQYGTELSDFDFEKQKIELKRILTLR